jgi:hypothetical protein
MESHMIDIVFIALIAVTIICGVMLVHNERVYRFRGRLINFCFEMNMGYLRATGTTPDLDAWRWLDSLATYNEMALRPWRPLDSWVTGEYAKEFFAWQKSGCLRLNSAARAAP